MRCGQEWRGWGEDTLVDPPHRGELRVVGGGQQGRWREVVRDEKGAGRKRKEVMVFMDIDMTTTTTPPYMRTHTHTHTHTHTASGPGPILAWLPHHVSSLLWFDHLFVTPHLIHSFLCTLFALGPSVHLEGLCR